MKKKAKKATKPETLKARPLTTDKASRVKGGLAPGGSGGTQSEDEIYIWSR